MRKQWFVKNIKEDINQLSAKYNIHPVLIRLLLNRDVPEEDFEKFLNPSFENSSYNPFLMKDLDLAVRAILRAIDKDFKIRIIGDYDQDGNSSILTFMDGLMILTDHIDYDIPHRVKDGYGLSKRLLDQAKEDDVDLIITCDLGITNIEEVEYAKELGLHIIITDHHEPKREDGKDLLPDALAVVNPKREDCPYPFKKLAGAGVVFKIIQGLFIRIQEDPEYLLQLLEYTAMATVCDVVDLVDENRLFVKEGLKRLNITENYGLQALIRETGLKTEINVYALGFILGPCINASGRLATAKMAAEMLLEENTKKIDEYAKKLVGLNEKRKKMTEDGLKRIREEVLEKGYDEDSVIVVYDKDLHESIAGIIAGRLKDEFYRPTLVFTSTEDEKILKGSGRSIEEYNLFEKLTEVDHLLEKYGGHTQAAGVSLLKEDFEKFREELNEKANLDEEDLIEKIYLDSTLYANEITFDLIDLIGQMEPYGKGNRRPVFGDKGAKIKKISLIGKEENILKLELDIRGRNMEGIMFSAEPTIEYLKEELGAKDFAQLIVGLPVENELDIAYYPEINEFRGEKNIQLRLVDIRVV